MSPEKDNRHRTCLIRAHGPTSRNCLAMLYNFLSCLRCVRAASAGSHLDIHTDAVTTVSRESPHSTRVERLACHERRKSSFQFCGLRGRCVAEATGSNPSIITVTIARMYTHCTEADATICDCQPRPPAQPAAATSNFHLHLLLTLPYSFRRSMPRSQRESAPLPGTTGKL